LKVPTVWLGLIPFFIYQFAYLGSNFIIPNFLIEAKGASSTLAGFSLLPGTLLGAILAPVFSKFYDLKGPTIYLEYIIYHSSFNHGLIH